MLFCLFSFLLAWDSLIKSKLVWPNAKNTNEICSENFGALNKRADRDTVSWKSFSLYICFSFKGAPEFPPNSLLSFLLLVTVVSQSSSSPDATGRRLVLPKGHAATFWGWSTVYVFLGEACQAGKYSFSWSVLSWTAEAQMACPSLLGSPVTSWRESSHWMIHMLCQFSGEWRELLMAIRGQLCLWLERQLALQGEKMDWEWSNCDQHLLI